MNGEKIIDHQRIRQTHRSFGFVPHRFLRDGFLSTLKKPEALLYLFYILAADRFGVSFYSDPGICKILNVSTYELRTTRDALIHKDLICTRDRVCQVLELPSHPVGVTNRSHEAGSFSNLNRRLKG